LKPLIRWAPAGAAAITLALASPAAAEPPAGRQAKVCFTCHKTVEPGTIRGYFDEYSLRSRSIQVKVDGEAEVLSFDPAGLQVSNAPGAGELEKALHSVKKGAEVRIVYTVEGGVKRASALSVKPKLKVAAERQVTTEQLEALVAAGPEQGKYVLFDARPAPKYAEGFIPTAESLPFPAFEKEQGKLPADKSTLVIFYCGGVTCAMSPAARDAAEALGHTNAKVYHEGIPVWSKAHPLALSPRLLKEAWLDRQQPLILLDARREAAGGVIAGAVAFPDASRKALDTLFRFRKLRPPIVVYDDGKGRADQVAAAIVKEGYAAMVLTGGVAGWRAAGYELAKGAPARAIVYTPRPKPGELAVADFKALVAARSADTVLLDVRNADEVAAGAFPGAIHIPADQVATRTAELPKDKRIVAHCSTGTRAEMVYNVLKGAGFTKVVFLATTVEFDGGEAEIGE
jgi:rhodanese-related sulfurtransferase